MEKINLDKINEKALYRVVQIDELPHLFYIHTDFDVDYEISIKQSSALVQSGCYTLNIRNIWGQKSPGDAKFKQTLIAIIEEFFNVYNDVLLYITETEDNKQAFRDRLFVRWFNTYAHRDQFYIQSAQGKMDGKMNFMAIISRLDNARLPQAIKEFEAAVAFLFD